MRQGIHKRVFERLFIGWIISSVAIGSTVFFLEMKKVDQRVLELALNESATFAAADPVRFAQPDADYLQVLREKSEDLVSKHFLVIELYNPERQMILQTVRSGEWETEARLSRYIHKFPREDSLLYDKFYVEKEVLLQILVPLKGADGKLFGYFEGVYQVPSDTMRHINGDVVRTLVLVIVVISVSSILLYPIIVSLNRGLIKLAHDLLKSNIELMTVLGSAVALRDSDTNAHNYRVTIYASRLAETLGLQNARIRNLIAGAFLHDVGKIGVSDNILLKPGKLTEEEFKVMRNHVTLGLDVINKAEWLQTARDVVEFHHEKYDGSGYLSGLKGETIPVNARIFAIVDVFDALTSRRPYKEPLSFDQTMGMLQRDSGVHFDPKLMEVFGRIARTLYSDIHDADERTLKQELDKLVGKYFLA